MSRKPAFFSNFEQKAKNFVCKKNYFYKKKFFNNSLEKLDVNFEQKALFVKRLFLSKRAFYICKTKLFV